MIVLLLPSVLGISNHISCFYFSVPLWQTVQIFFYQSSSTRSRLHAACFSESLSAVCNFCSISSFSILVSQAQNNTIFFTFKNMILFASIFFISWKTKICFAFLILALISVVHLISFVFVVLQCFYKSVSYFPCVWILYVMGVIRKTTTLFLINTFIQLFLKCLWLNRLNTQCLCDRSHTTF